MKFACIQAESASFDVTMMCRMLGVARSGYYAWCKHVEPKRKGDDAQLAALVTVVHRESDCVYGARRVRKELRGHGLRYGVRRISRLMREQQLEARKPRPRPSAKRDEALAETPLENVLNRNFKVEAPNRAWVGDITYVWTREVGFVFVAILLDLFARRVVGWSVSRTADAQLACNALEMAIGRRDIDANLVIHHDQGVQYRSNLYQTRVAEIGARPSFSRRGNCWDNAVAESFFATMKTEIGPKLDASRDEMEVRAAVAAYVEKFYNVRRLHSAIDYEAPARYEARMAA